MRAVEKKFYVRLSANHERNKLDGTVEIEHLFSYGTLQLEEVQLETFGRKLDGQPDALLGYRLAMITITDEAFVVKSGTVLYEVGVGCANRQGFGKLKGGSESGLTRGTEARGRRLSGRRPFSIPPP